MTTSTALRTVGITAVAVSLALVGCGSKTTEPSASSSTTKAATSASASSSTAATPKVAPRTAPPSTGTNPTIADFIKANGIVETVIHRGDPGAPTIDLPFPPGWENAGADTPDYAYGAIVYTGPEAAQYTPSIVALVSKLTGNMDPQKIIDLAPGELKNLPGYAGGEGSTSTLGGFPAVQLGGPWTKDGQAQLIAQKTVVIPGNDGLYVLQLNADGLQSQGDIVSAATDVIDAQTTITP